METHGRRTQSLTALVALIASFMLPALHGQLEFTELRTTPAVPNTLGNRWALGDVNEDGAVDAIRTLPLVPDPQLLLGTLGGPFQSGVLLPPHVLGPHPANDSIADIKLHDVDGDGHLDLVGSMGGAPPRIVTALGAGDGTFAAGVSTPTSTSAGTLWLAELTGDGIPDVLLLSISLFAPGVLQLQAGVGDGTFGSPQLLMAPLSLFAAAMVGDLDGDGDDDVLISPDIHAPALHSLLSDGAGGFTTVESNVAPSKPDWVLLADADGDGIADLVRQRKLQPVSVFPAEYAVQVERGAGDGTFLPGAVVALVDSQPAGVGDLDGDGLPDMVLLVGTELQVLRGLGGLVFADDGVLPGASPNGVVHVLDLDGDARNDLLVTSYDTSIAAAFSRTYQLQDPFQDVGSGMGLAGQAQPRLWTTGPYLPGSLAHFRLENAPTQGEAWLLAGASTMNMPLAGGMLVPRPDAVIGPIQLNASGELEFTGTWPSDLVELPELWFQLWVVTPDAPLGHLATNGVRAAESLRGTSSID